MMKEYTKTLLKCLHPLHLHHHHYLEQHLPRVVNAEHVENEHAENEHAENTEHVENEHAENEHAENAEHANNIIKYKNVFIIYGFSNLKTYDQNR